jgi:hypothetical protein
MQSSDSAICRELDIALVTWRSMAESVVQNMRDRVRQLRKMTEMTHNPEIIQLLRKMAQEIEADADRLESAICGSSDGNGDVDQP